LRDPESRQTATGWERQSPLAPMEGQFAIRKIRSEKAMKSQTRKQNTTSRLTIGASRRLLCAVLLVLMAHVFVQLAKGQAVSVAEVDGYVTDPQGRPVGGAQITIVETGKNQVHSAISDAQTGRYSFPELPVGTYELTVSANGFKRYVSTGIVLEVASNISVNAPLEIGTVSQTVDVRSSATMLETKDNSIAQVIDARRMVDLPLNGRNPTQLITLTGAATTSSSSDLITSKNIGGSNASATFSIAGSQANGVNYLLDGGDNNDSLFNVNLPLPFPDALQEFSVQTTALPAQYGLHPGGVVNAVTKSGTNSFHGDVFDFLRNGDMDAIQKGTPLRDSLKRNQFGGVLGGRIIRDKLFFFGGYQGTRQRSNPPSQISYVATAAALNGDFSTLEAPASAGGCLSGSTGRTLTNPVTHQPFPGNQIPVSMFSAPAVTMLSKYLPISTNKCGTVQYGLPANNPDDQVIGRIDYVQNQKHSMYGRYYIYDFTVETTFNGSNLLTTQAAGQIGRSQTFTYGDTYAFNATTLNSFHATFDRRRDNRGAASTDISPTTLGINMTAPLPNFVFFTVSNYFSVGCGTCSPGYFNANTYQVSDDVNLVRGKNEIAFGGDFRRLQGNLLTNTYTNGEITFNGGHTGDALADLLLGDIYQFNQGNPQPDALRQSVFSLYGQDTYRASRRLTANLGLRWEPSQFPHDAYGRTPQFSQSAFNAGTVSTKYPDAPAGLVFPGDPGSYKGLSQVKSYWLGLSPRVGVILDPRGQGRETIRAGFGLMHDTGMLYYPERWTYSPPFASQVIVTNPTGSLADPWAGQPGGNPFPSSGYFPNAGTYYVIPTNTPPTYMMQWNLTVQQQVAPDWMFQVGYLGTKSVHVWGQYDINPSVYIPGSTAAANQRRLLYLQNKDEGQYYGAIYSGDPGGNSKYNAMLATLQHRFADHFQMASNYTMSHCISDTDLSGEVAGTYRENPYSRSMERGNCMFNHFSIFNISGVVTSPTLGTGVIDSLIRDWQVSPLIIWSTGVPLNITDGGLDISQTAQGNDRPNQILPTPYPEPQTPSEWFNPGAFAKQAAGTFGTVGRNSLNGPGSFDLDAALSRTFPIKESLGLTFRAEAFNALNHPVWQNPTTSISSAQFGRITTYGSPRIMQLALKLSF
jgi:Carboxypeptidase regulatory-like domain